MTTTIKKGKTIICTDYYACLGDYLDELGIKWSSKSIDNIGDFINIYFDKELSPSEIFGFAMDFASYRDRIINQ